MELCCGVKVFALSDFQVTNEHKIQPPFGGDAMIDAAVAEKQGGVVDGALG